MDQEQTKQLLSHLERISGSLEGIENSLMSFNTSQLSSESSALNELIELRSVVSSINKLSDVIETALDKGLINDFTDNPYLWEIYQALHLNRDEKFPNAMTEISNSLKSIAENWE